LEIDKKWSSQLLKSLRIVVFNVNLLILVTLTSVLRTLVNKTLIKLGFDFSSLVLNLPQTQPFHVHNQVFLCQRNWMLSHSKKTTVIKR